MHLSFVSSYYLPAAKCDSVTVFNRINELLATIKALDQWRTKLIFNPLVKRLKSDEVLQEMMKQKLKDRLNPSEKISIPTLITQAQGLSKAIKSWCIDEINEQTKSGRIPEVGLDISIGEYRSVALSLLELILTHH